MMLSGGVFYRPIKQQITLCLDADLVDWLTVIISRMRVIRLLLTGLCGSMFRSISLEAFWQEDGIYEEV
jgi:hypothetical protein